MASTPERRNRFAPTSVVRRGIQASHKEQRLDDPITADKTNETVSQAVEQQPAVIVRVNRFCRRIVPR